MRTAVKIALGLLGGGAGVSAFATYHVDSVNGSDANDGSTPAKAFQTLGAVPTLQTGESIGLARESVFRAQKLAGITVNNTSILAYGDGARPVIDGSTNLDSGGWTKTADLTNVYERAITFDADPSGYITVFENDGYLLRRATNELVDANPGSYRVTSDTAGSATLYIHASDSGDPASNGKVYDFSSTNLTINSFGATGTILRDIVFQRSIYQNGPVFLGKNSQVYNCEFNQGARHNFIARGGLYMEDCTFTDGYFANAGATLFVCFEQAATEADGFTLVRCIARNTNSPDTNVTGYLNHDASSPGANFGQVSYIDCEAIDCALGISAIDSSLYTITNFSASGCPTGISCGAVTTFNVTNPTITGCTNGVRLLAAGTLNLVDPSISLSASTFGNCVDQSVAGLINLSGGTLTSATPTFDGARACFGSANVAAHWNIDGVRFAIRRPTLLTGVSQVIDAMDNNSYSTAALIWNYQNTGYVGLSDWRTATGFDANSTQDT